MQAPAERYAQQVHLPEIGAAEQEKLRRARVLIVGVGGLGSPSALYLSAAGVGTLGLIDPDAVDLSNLQRQIIHAGEGIGIAKVESAARSVRARNPDVNVHIRPEALTARRAGELFPEYDFVIDGTDGTEAKFLINDAAILTGTPYSHAGAIGWIGQTMTVLPGRSACFRCLFPEPPDGDAPTCQFGGIFGAVAGTLGVIQATEALKYILGIGRVLADRLLGYDALALRWREIPLSRNVRCPACGPRRTLHAQSQAATEAPPLQE